MARNHRYHGAGNRAGTAGGMVKEAGIKMDDKPMTDEQMLAMLDAENEYLKAMRVSGTMTPNEAEALDHLSTMMDVATFLLYRCAGLLNECSELKLRARFNDASKFSKG